VCDGDVADPYVANAPKKPSGYTSRRQALAVTADQIVNNSEYEVWDALDQVTVGCDWGGTMTFAPTDDGTDLALHRCEFTDHFPVSGTGTIDADGVVDLHKIRTPALA
jgi:hypothetical protein